jgi:hypothetical protein
LATDFLKFRLHFLPQNVAPSMQSFGGGKFLATYFLKFRLHFLPQNFAPSMQNRKLLIPSHMYYVVCIQNRKVQNSLRSVENCFAISSSAALEKLKSTCIIGLKLTLKQS